MEKIFSIILTAMLVSGCMCFGKGGESAVTTTTKQEGKITTTLRGVMTTTTLQESSIGKTIVDMATALTSGGAYKCTYTEQGMQSETWIKGQKFKSITNVDNQLVNYISDGTWIYFWAEGGTQGTKIKIEDTQEPESQSMDVPDLDEVARTAMNVRCEPIVVLDSTFIPPRNVQFTDFSQLMTQEGELQDPCSYCNMITDLGDKQDCLESC
jgi:hypothetical protein